MSTDPTEPRAPREFKVSYSSGHPPRAGQPRSNTFGLTGEGKILFDGATLTFQGNRPGFRFGGAPTVALTDVVSAEYHADKQAFLLHFRKPRGYAVFWMPSREEAESLWAVLPHEKSPEFLAEEAEYERYGQVMKSLGTRFHVTPAIIAINVAVFIIMLAAGADLMRPHPAILIRFGSNFGPLTWSGEEWRLISSAFLHVGLIHILMNMFALYQGGALIERLFGSTRFALIYLLSALSGSIVSAWWDPLRNTAGASGAIFGVYGALLAFLAVRRADIPGPSLKAISRSTVLFSLFSLGFGAWHPLVNNACHVGGLLGGIVAGLVLARPFTLEERARRQPVRLLIAAVVVGLPLALMAKPLLAEGGQYGAEIKFLLALENFDRREPEIVRRQTDILTFPPNARVNRLEVAKRLREEVLAPWRQASKPILESANITREDAPSAQLQVAMRRYVRARDEAVALRVLSLESGNPSDEAQADSADRRLDEAVRALNLLAESENGN